MNNQEARNKLENMKLKFFNDSIEMKEILSDIGRKLKPMLEYNKKWRNKHQVYKIY